MERAVNSDPTSTKAAQGDTKGPIPQGQELEKELQHVQEQFKAILENITDPFIIVDREWHLTYANSEAARMATAMHRYSDELVGRSFWDEFPDMRSTPGSHELRRAMDQTTPVRYEEFLPPLNKWFDVRAYPFGDGLSICARDITESIRLREELRVMSVHDELTGLGNRRGFFTLAHQQLKIADRTRRKAYLFFADFDSLKQINDSFGHLEGDWALTRNRQHAQEHLP